MIIFEQQRLIESAKDEQWRKNQVDALCSRVNEFGEQWFRMWQNYRLKNSQIDQDEFREYCDTLGLSKGEDRKFVEPFNKTYNIIEVLKGEENSMPWTYGVINLSPEASNEMLREKKRDLLNYIDFKLSSELEKSQMMMQMQSQGIDTKSQEGQQQLKELQAKIKEKEDLILKPEDIHKKYSNYKSLKERTVHKLLQSLAVNQNLKWLKNESFEHALIAGIECVEIEVDDYGKLPRLRQLDPLTIFYHKSPNSPFIQYGDYVGYKEEMAIADVLDKFGDQLNDDDVKKLKIYNSQVYGTNVPFSSKGGESASKWDELKKYEYTYQNILSTIPSTGTTSVLSDGMYTSGLFRNKFENYSVVYTTYWRSQRKIGKLSTLNEYGKMEDTFVDEMFKVPTRAKKSTYKPHTFSRDRIKYEWKDNQGKPYELEWIWVPEIWKGVRINGDIYVKIEPYEHAYQSLLNPYKTKLPIYGFIYNNRNAYSMSIMDKMKPWQKLYYIIASKWLKLITQDKGVINLLNILMMDKKIGYKESLQIAVDQGTLPYNPLAHSQGAGLGNTAKPAERLDLSNTEQIARYTQMLEFVEQQMELAAGVPKSRLAQTATSSNVTDNQRDVIQSMNISASLFAGHELLWQEILQGLMETAVKSLDGQSGYLRELLSDQELAVIDLSLISMDDEYAVRVGNSNKTFKILEQAKGLAQALIQNDKIRFSMFLDLLDTDNLAEFKDELRAIEDDISNREIQAQQAQQQHEKEMQEQTKQHEIESRQFEFDKIDKEGEWNIKEAEIKAFSWNEDKDLNDNNVPDVLEIDKFRHSKEIADGKLDIENQKLDLDKQKLAQSNTEMMLKNKQAIEKLKVDRIKKKSQN